MLTQLLKSGLGTIAYALGLFVVLTILPFQPAQTQPSGRPQTLYLSPSGSDSNNGSASAPWKTFRHAFSQMHAGNELILQDGVYQRSTTGLLIVNCTSAGLNGEPGKRITVRAEHERRAWLKSDGTTPPVYLESCRYWNIVGLNASNADWPGFLEVREGSVFFVIDSDHIVLQRNIASRNNRYGNSHLFILVNSADSHLVENEGYYFHRHGIATNGSKNIVTRRNYINSRHYEDLPTGWPSHPNAQDEGDEGLVFYTGTSDSISENDIVVHSEGLWSLGPRNRFLGSIAIEGDHGFAVFTRHTCNNRTCYAVDNYFENILAVNNGVGVRFLDAERTIGRGMTIANAKRRGFEGWKREAYNPDRYNFPGLLASFDVSNVLSINNTGTGVFESKMDGWRGDYLNAWNNDPDFDPVSGDDGGQWTNKMSLDPGMGSCLAFVPNGSAMKGAGRNGGDVGANILYRYVNGILTDWPLWNPATGAFPCGAIVSGLNDVPGESCFDVHKRLNVNANGCSLPPDYPR